YDGWSTGIILKEYFQTYNALATGKEAVKPGKTKYKEFVKWLQGQDISKQEEFWKEYFSGLGTPPGLSMKTRTVEEQEHPDRYTVSWGEGVKTQLEEYARENKHTLATLIYTAWGILLQKYNNSEDIVFGTTVSGRPAQITGIEEIVGLFINTLPLRVAEQRNEKNREMVKRINSAIQSREEYENTSLVSLKEYIGLGANAELFDTILVIENYPLDKRMRETGGSLTPHSYTPFEMTNYDLTVAVTAFGEITVDIIYNPAKFERGQIGAIADHYLNLVRAIVKNPDKEPHQLEMLSEIEKHRLLVQFNSEATGNIADKIIHQLVEEQAARTPENIAVTGLSHSAGSTLQNLTYKELNKISGAIARNLLLQGAGEQDIIGILVDRTVEMITGILGILKAGKAYLPLNPKAPAERNRYMLEDCNVKTLLTVEYMTSTANEITTKKRIVYLDEKDETKTGIKESEEREAQPQVSPSQNAYVIFTSGSTGKPKGVPITHANLSPLLHWGYKHLGIGPQDRAIQLLSYYFDWSVWEIFINLTSGARLYMISEEIQMDAEASVEFITKNKITVVHATPTQWQYLLPSRRENTKETGLESLRHLCIGAEKLNFDLVERSIAVVSEECRIYNMYGPTEATIIATILTIDKTALAKYEKLSSVPIGIPAGNTDLLVLDRHLNPTPLYVEGELYIGGEGVAKGYLNNPELTAERFVNYKLQATKNKQKDHEPEVGTQILQDVKSPTNKSFWESGTPLSKRVLPAVGPPAARFYRSGDRVRWLPDGTIEFFGRLDLQVKIRGFRIELGEIENQLLAHEEVKEAVVVAKNPGNRELYLCAYYVEKDGAWDNTQDSGKLQKKAALLKKYLARYLPEYMIPTYFMPIESVPLNPNGKVDMKALPEPGTGKATLKYVAPENQVQKKLVEIWAAVLVIDPGNIGIEHNFFQLGGHSLKATRLTSKIHKELEVNVPLPELFKQPTIKALAA
ncbi:MAG: amino acid adenylation domain-containing protein, partial [bacterium]|nr:amino acid adenylation domain-containing protein [bacterium]